MTKKLITSLCILCVVVIISFGVCADEKEAFNIQDMFTPSGWMGDGEFGRKYIIFTGAHKADCHSLPDCVKIKYTFGPKRWAGIYWQNKPDNWGDNPGEDFSDKGYTKATFWAKGETGKEKVKFKVGGIDNPSKNYQDSFGKTAGMIILTKEWKQYEINLANENISSVIGGFCWVTSEDDNNSKSITFYIDDIVYQ